LVVENRPKYAIDPKERKKKQTAESIIEDLKHMDNMIQAKVVQTNWCVLIDTNWLKECQNTLLERTCGKNMGTQAPE